MGWPLIKQWMWAGTGNNDWEETFRIRLSNIIAMLVALLISLQLPIVLTLWDQQSSTKSLLILMHVLWILSCVGLNQCRFHDAARLSLVLGFASYISISCIIWPNDLATHYFLLLGVFASPFLHSKAEKQQTLWVTALFMGLFWFFDYLWFPPAGPWQTSVSTATIIQTTNSLFFSISIWCISHFTHLTLNGGWRKTIASDQAANQLLRKTLPDPIALRLKSVHQIADHHDQVSVLFCDIRGFTDLCRRLPAPDLVNVLDTLFHRLDDLADEHQLEKIKTNGDEYMLVAGAPERRRDDPQRVCRFALAAQWMFNDFCREFRLPLGLRIGIATGEAIAGIIGRKRLCYDLWGETVVRASRLESHGLEGKIQICQRTFQRVSTCFQAEYRGMIDCKGLGELPTYWLIRQR